MYVGVSDLRDGVDSISAYAYNLRDTIPHLLPIISGKNQRKGTHDSSPHFHIGDPSQNRYITSLSAEWLWVKLIKDQPTIRVNICSYAGLFVGWSSFFPISVFCGSPRQSDHLNVNTCYKGVVQPQRGNEDPYSAFDWNVRSSRVITPQFQRHVCLSVCLLFSIIIIYFIISERF